MAAPANMGGNWMRRGEGYRVRVRVRVRHKPKPKPKPNPTPNPKPNLDAEGWVEHSRGEGDADDVVREGPEEVEPDAAHHDAREVQRGDDILQRRLHQHDVRRLDRHVGPAAHLLRVIGRGSGSRSGLGLGLGSGLGLGLGLGRSCRCSPAQGQAQAQG